MYIPAISVDKCQIWCDVDLEILLFFSLLILILSGTSNDSWTGGSIVSQLNPDILEKIKNCFQVWTSHYYIGGIMTPLYILGFTTTSETQATTFIPPHWTPKSWAMEDRVREHCLCSFTGLRAVGQHVGRPPNRLPGYGSAQCRRDGRGKENIHGSHGRS